MKKEKQEIKKGIPVSGVAGILLLFVVVSIAYANYVVYFGTEGWLPKLMLIPSTVFVGVFLFYKAYK